MNGPIKDSLRNRCLQYILKHGPCTVAKAASALGRYISAAGAVRNGHSRLVAWSRRLPDRSGKRGRPNPSNPRYTSSKLEAMGKRDLIANNLARLFRDGHLSRPSRGVYGPPLPKLFQPAESA